MSLKQLSRVAVLSALCVVLRYLFAPLPNVQPLTAIFLVLASVNGLAESLGVMVISLLVSSFFFLFGPWVFWQIVSFTLVILFWQFLIFPWAKQAMVLQALGAASLAFFYGMMIDGLMALFYGSNPWLHMIAGTSFNLVHALSTLVCYPLVIQMFRRFEDEKII
ncbi:ECF transporter S component [Streptococcus sp. sy018]|uniref:ECF transporter S component n=1 Tax=Streptococcus sp. sy018 TaxID=2600147 RepID=UPI0011B408E3|nr:ECF transporter S component [Streptococcus sp. sy018]TWS94200.1 ECF transporter S component [Streptococcus sp. sy018]